MKKKTSQIKQQLQTLDSIEERLELLSSAYKDDVAYLVTCGPSLTKHDQKVLKSKLKDKLVICAKQSFNYLSDICDFHLVSTYNFQPYTYDNEHTIKSWQLTASNMDNELHRIINEWQHDIDIYFPVISGPWITLEGTTAYTRNFDNWKQLGTDTRVMWGPGILYESGFPLCYLLGVKKIVTIGWDIGDLSRYEDNDRDPNWIEQHSADLYTAKVGRGPSYTELKNTIECTSAMYDWFAREKIDVEILSDTNPADKRFKRTTLNEI